MNDGMAYSLSDIKISLLIHISSNIRGVTFGLNVTQNADNALQCSRKVTRYTLTILTFRATIYAAQAQFLFHRRSDYVVGYNE